MKVYQTNEIKNIALLGNDGSGKTTLTEALLFESGIIKRRGRITAKNTVGLRYVLNKNNKVTNIRKKVSGKFLANASFDST